MLPTTQILPIPIVQPTVTSKRRLQNRNAQRTFRERQEATTSNKNQGATASSSSPGSSQDTPHHIEQDTSDLGHVGQETYMRHNIAFDTDLSNLHDGTVYTGSSSAVPWDMSYAATALSSHPPNTQNARLRDPRPIISEDLNAQMELYQIAPDSMPSLQSPSNFSDPSPMLLSPRQSDVGMASYPTGQFYSADRTSQSTHGGLASPRSNPSISGTPYHGNRSGPGTSVGSSNSSSQAINWMPEMLPDHIDDSLFMSRPEPRRTQSISDPAQRLPLLHLATRNRNHSVIRVLLRRGTSSVDDRDEDGRTALHLAAEAGDEVLVSLLLSNGADAKLADWNGCDPLFVAVREGHSEVVELLLDQLGL